MQQKNNNQKPCERNYLCRNLKEGKCSHHHTEQQRSYGNIYKFLREIFIAGPQQKLILGRLKKFEGSEKYKLIPCNKEILQQYSELSFSVIEDPEAIILSEEFYYEAKYEEKDDKNGVFYVKVLKKWGKFGEAKDDVEAIFYGQVPIYEEFTGNFKQGVFHEKRNGDKIIKYKDERYFIVNEKDQNRALSGSTVEFRGSKKCAQIVSIVKNPLEDADIYGMLEASSDSNKRIDMVHLYCPLPEVVNWALLEEIFQKTGKVFATSFKNPTLIREEEFQDKYAGILQAKPEDPNVLYLTDVIFMSQSSSLEISQAKKRWDSLLSLVNHQKLMKQAQGNYYFKSLNKDLPIFQCLPIKEGLLKENPELWRSYVKVKYVGWPAASNHPWMKIESFEGLIGDSEDDIRVILKRNRVTTDWFSKEVQEDEKELMKAWDEKIQESLESCEKIEEKVFTIDGESTRYRDDGFSVKKLANEEYEIGIHIADVTRIVKEETEIYKEAEKRFHSCYIGNDFFRPMLSKNLGEHLSLKQDQWRFAFSAFILMNKEGVIDLEKTRFKHVMIKPARNFTYKQVDQIIVSQTAGDDEVKEAILLMNELGTKLNERRKRLGCRLEIDEEDAERNSQAHKMVEEFMVLANEIATDFVKHQEEILSNKLVKIRNEEKKIVREAGEKKEEEEEKMIVKEEEETELELEGKDIENTEEIKEEDEKVKEEIEDKEEKISEKEEVSEDEEEVEIKRKGSESEEKSQTDSDISSSNERKMKEEDAMKAYNFLGRTWSSAIDVQLDLSDKLAFLESQRRMKESTIERISLRKYLEYLLIVKNQMIELVLRKKLFVKNSQDQIESPWSNFGAQMQQIQSPGALSISEESPPSSPAKSLSEDLGLKFAIKITKSKPKKKSKYQQKETSLNEIYEGKREPEIFSPEIPEKISANNEEALLVQTNVINTEEIIIDKPSKEELEKKIEESEIIETINLDSSMIQEIPKEDEIKGEGQIEMEEAEKGEEGFSVKQSENIMKRYDHLENSQKMKFTSPIRRFSDILVHRLIDEIVQIEEEILKINETIQGKLTEQEEEGEEKEKKIKTRYQIFQDLDSQLRNRISQLEKLQKKMRIYYEENSSNKKGGMNRAEREKDHMEVCKSVINGQESILADALVIGISEKEKKVNLFLSKYSFECTLSCWKIETYGGQRAKIYFEDKSSVEVIIWRDIKVEINVQKTFPLDFKVSYHRKNKK